MLPEGSSHKSIDGIGQESVVRGVVRGVIGGEVERWRVGVGQVEA
jgi:hypothetical protein